MQKNPTLSKEPPVSQKNPKGSLSAAKEPSFLRVYTTSLHAWDSPVRLACHVTPRHSIIVHEYNVLIMADCGCLQYKIFVCISEEIFIRSLKRVRKRIHGPFLTGKIFHESCYGSSGVLLRLARRAIMDHHECCYGSPGELLWLTMSAVTARQESYYGSP